MAPQVELARIPEPTDENEIMREQLDYLIEHATGNGQCGCSVCQRYLRARSVLLEIFGEPKTAKVLKIGPEFAKAA
jgi:hypothetical protein